MDKNTRYILLALAGGVGVYIIYKGGYLATWFPSLFAPAVPSTTGNGASPASNPVAGQTATCTALAKKVGIDNPYSEVLAKDVPQVRQYVTLSADQEAMLVACGAVDLTAAQWSVIMAATGKGPATTPPANNPPPPAPYVPPCPAGQYGYNGQCVPVGSSANDTLTKIATAAGSSGPLLNMDQWCYFAAQVGVTCPDPGSIDPDLYAGAWGPGTDRTTPIAADTFWYLATQTDPSLKGLRGMQALSGFLT